MCINQGCDRMGNFNTYLLQFDNGIELAEITRKPEEEIPVYRNQGFSNEIFSFLLTRMLSPTLELQAALVHVSRG